MSLAKDKEYSVLFIGNSYTYFNEMPDIFKNIAADLGYRVKVVSITKGGYQLYKHADPMDPIGEKVDAALCSGKKFDFVILQDQSVLPASDPAKFYNAVRSLNQRIRYIGAVPVLYSTWGRKKGHSTLEQYGWTNESMTYQLAASYSAIGQELGIEVAHVGLAFYDVYTSAPQIELYHNDSTHPSLCGSFLAAYTLFAQIFNCDPTECAYENDLEQGHGAILRRAAKKAVFDTPMIPKEYEKVSLGIE